MIGIGAIVLGDARVGKGAIVGAGSVVLEGEKIPAGMLAVGVPAKVVRRVTARDHTYIRRWVKKYIHLANAYKMKK
jgi:carbonic anhydrase/acetyltransferase-like protein (isoleucine patch superfamily)